MGSKTSKAEESALLKDGKRAATAFTVEAPAEKLADEELVDIFAWKNCGYLAQYFAVGIIYGGLPATLYGFFIG